MNLSLFNRFVDATRDRFTLKAESEVYATYEGAPLPFYPMSRHYVVLDNGVVVHYPGSENVYDFLMGLVIMTRSETNNLNGMDVLRVIVGGVDFYRNNAYQWGVHYTEGTQGRVEVLYTSVADTPMLCFKAGCNYIDALRTWSDSLGNWMDGE